MMKPNAGQRSASESKPEAKTEPRPEAKAERKSEAEPKPEAQAGVAALLNTSLGDLLQPAQSKTRTMPNASQQRLSPQAATPDAAAKDPERGPEPKTETEVEPKPGIKAKAPPDSTPQATE